MAIITKVNEPYIATGFIEELTIDEFVHVRSWVGTSLSDTIYMLGPIDWVEKLDSDILCVHYEDGLEFFLDTHKPQVTIDAYKAFYEYQDSK